MTRYPQRERERRPRFEKGLRPFVDHFPSSFGARWGGVVLRTWLPLPLSVFVFSEHGTLVLLLLEEEQISALPIFFAGEKHEGAVGPQIVSSTEEEVVGEAFERYHLSGRYPVSPSDQQVGSYHGTRFCRLAAWPGPLYVLPPVGREAETVVMMPLPDGEGANRCRARVVRLPLDEVGAGEEEITGASLERVFDLLLWRHRRQRVAVFHLLRGLEWTGTAIASALVFGLQGLIAGAIWYLGTGVPLSVGLHGACTLVSLLVGPLEALVLLQPLLFPGLLAGRARARSWLRALLTVLLLLLASVTIAFEATLGHFPAIDGRSLFAVTFTVLLPLLNATMVVWGLVYILRPEESWAGKGEPPEQGVSPVRD